MQPAHSLCMLVIMPLIRPKIMGVLSPGMHTQCACTLHSQAAPALHMQLRQTAAKVPHENISAFAQHTAWPAPKLLLATMRSGRSARRCAPGHELLQRRICNVRNALSSAGTAHAVRTWEMLCFVPLPIARRAPVVRCSPLQGVEHAHHDAMPGRTAQVFNPQSVLVEVLPVHGKEALALRAQVAASPASQFPAPTSGHARRRMCLWQPRQAQAV